jgi:hypothetical protein
MSRKTRLSRRTVLKGIGACMGLPLLEAMGRDVRAAGNIPPVRLAFMFVPNGVIVPNWKPEGEGAEWQLSRTLTPLQPHKDEINLFTGLTQHHGRANGDGAGDHARCAGSFLTGAQPYKTSGANIRVGISADQAVAEEIGDRTLLPSLELGIERGRNSGNCDSGYSCAYSTNISWKTATTPMSKEVNPKLAFERLFGANEGSKEQAERDFYRKSILDSVAEDADQLRKKLGKTDQRKIDEYFTAVRELEQRIAREAVTRREVPEYDLPAGVPRELKTHIRVMFDVLTLAFQTDTTRIATFMLANAGSNRSYPMVGVSGGHHSLSHHRNEAKKMEDLTKIDIFLVTQFGYFIDRLKSVQEGEGTLLDNCLALYGSGIGDGNRHTHHDLPIVLAGNGGGRIETGRLMHYANDTPLNNLFLSMSELAGAKLESHGDSTGLLPKL